MEPRLRDEKADPVGQVIRYPMIRSIFQADALHLPLPDQAVDLCFFSPPYLKARWYGDREKHVRGCIQWVDWMLEVVREACRVTRGLVLVNCAGSTEKWRYQPGPEMLLSEWFKQGGECWRPCYWKRVGIPGSGGRQWYRADVEYILAFKANPGPVPWSDNIANGHVPRWAPGGAMSHRTTVGARVNQWGHPIDSGGTTGQPDDVTDALRRTSHRLADANPTRSVWGGSCRTRRPCFTSQGPSNGPSTIRRFPEAADGTVKGGHDRDICAKANPGNVVNIIVGGGVMGHKLAHENEAPFPVDLPRYFIRSHCPPEGIVLDQFGGSGSTAHAAIIEGRGYITCDIRKSQTDLMTRRLADVMASSANNNIVKRATPPAVSRSTTLTAGEPRRVEPSIPADGLLFAA